MTYNLELFGQVIQKPDVIISKKDLRKVAKEYQMTKKNLIKKLNKNGYEYDRRAKGYIYLDSNTKPLKNDCIAPHYDIEKLYEIQMMLIDKLNQSNTEKQKNASGINRYDSDIIEADLKLVADFDNTKFKQTSIKVNEEIWEEFNRNCKENHKQLDKQELISIALRDFNLKYNK